MPEFRLMDTRSLRIKEETASMWQDFYSDLTPFGKTSKYFNDFHSWVADEWTATEIDAGAGDTSQLLLDSRNGVLKILSAGNEDDGCQLQLGGTGDGETTGECWAPAAGKNLWFEASVALDEVTQSDFFIGLHVEDTTVIAGRGSDYIGFSSDDADALLDFTTCASSIASSDLGIHTLVANTYVTLGFKVTSTGQVDYYVNGVLKGTSKTNIPTGLMKLTIAYLTGAAAAKALMVDYIAVAQDR